MYSFSYSQVRSFLSCELKWYFDKVEGIRRISTKRAPDLGSVIHEGIAAMIRQEDAKAAIDAWVKTKYEALEPHFSDLPQLEEDWAEVEQQINDHALVVCERWREWINLDQWETIVHPEFGPLVERRAIHTESELSNPHGFAFEFPWITDWVAQDKVTGLIWVIDWKTKSAFDDDDNHQRNLQKMVYQYLLLHDMDIEVSGSRIAQIRSKAPSVPSLLKPKKDGSRAMSRAAIATDWATYKAALLAADLDPVDYEDMKIKMKPEDYWFKWQSAFRTEQQCENAWYQIILPAINRMRLMYEDKLQPNRNLGSMDCGTMCNMQMPCLETLAGRDLDNVISFGYERKEKTNEPA